VNVLKTYRSLTAEQKQAISQKRIDMSRPIGDLLAFLKPIAACDALSDKVRTKLGCTFGIAIVALVVLIFVFMGAWTGVKTIIILAVAAIMSWSFFLWRWTKSIDVSNNFRQFAIPVLTVLRDDFDPAQPVHLRIDLTGPTEKGKKRNETPPFKKGVYHKVVDSMYVDPWMTAEGHLVDGTKLSWEVTDTIRERSQTKRTARGKIKTKTKHKKKSSIDVSMGLRRKTYALAATEGEVSSDEKRHTVKLSRQVVTPSLDPIDPRALLDVVVDVFRAARPAKEVGA
jgi:hypothetical protein